MKNKIKTIIFISVIFISLMVNAQKQNATEVLISTNYGDIVIRLYDETPLHKKNFMNLVEQDFYDSLLFHRVIKSFMIQGGDPNSRNAAKGEMLGMGGPGYTIPAEIHASHFHKKGAIAAARRGDAVNPSKESSGSQFYIIQGQVFTEEQLYSMVKAEQIAPLTEEKLKIYTSIGGSPHLDGEYTVFGEVIAGLDVVDKIAALPVDAYNRPLEDVVYTMKIK